MQLSQQQLALSSSLTTLAQQAAGTAPVVVRNKLNGIATFTDENTKIQVIWEAYGDPTGKDIKEVSPLLLNNPQFREQILRGIFEIVDTQINPDVLANALNAQRGAWEARQLAASNAAVEVQKANDVVIATGQSCIAPRGPRDLCGAYALQMGKEEDNSRPPLCAEHQHLAPQYAPTTTGRQVDGKDEVIWKRVQQIAHQ